MAHRNGIHNNVKQGFGGFKEVGTGKVFQLVPCTDYYGYSDYVEDYVGEDMHIVGETDTTGDVVGFLANVGGQYQPVTPVGYGYQYIA